MKALYEKIIPLAANSFKAYAYEKQEFDNPWHYHPEYELTYIVSSHGVRYTGNHFENFMKDDFVLLGPNVPHCWKNTGSQNEKASAIVFHWDDNLLGTGWTDKREFQAIQRLLQSSERGLKFDRDVAIAMKSKLELLLTMPSFNKLISLLEILHELSTTSKSHPICERNFFEQLNLADHERINSIYQYVRKKYTEKITLGDIANEVHMGREPFSRFFSKIMNKPFFSFLNEYRVNAACKLLIESDLQVTQICYSCGFESLPFFYRQFKKYKGNSPHQYRSAYQSIVKRQRKEHVTWLTDV
jgi:AraC-like DNA-binding protein